LKIGTTEIKKGNEESLADYYDDMSDEELQDLQPIDEEIDKTIEKIDEIEESEEEDVKEAIHEEVLLESIGINTNSVPKFLELYPKKKVVYRNKITKHFLEWYIKKAKPATLKRLKLHDSEHISENQCKHFLTLIDKRLQKKDELEDTDTPKLINLKPSVMNENNMYEFLLNEKWDKREKGIKELDVLVKEQIETTYCDTYQALNNLISKFGLTNKFALTLFKTEKVKEEKPEKRSNAQITEDMKYSIQYSHYIKFLYNLMSEKMDFKEAPTEEDIKQIEEIKENFYGHLEQDNPIEEDESHQSIGQMKIDDGLEGFNT